MEQFFSELRDNLRPFNAEKADIVKLFIESNYGYMSGSSVRDAVDEFEKKSVAVLCGVDEFSALEKLAILLLLESAGMVKE